MSKRKGKHYSGVQMICPYFCREEDSAICCQSGECGGMRLRMAFRSIEAKKRWAGRHCESHEYWHCPLCEMIDEEERLREDGQS